MIYFLPCAFVTRSAPPCPDPGWLEHKALQRNRLRSLTAALTLCFHLQEYRFVVTARDGAPDPRLATATVTVELLDVEDEVPVFRQHSYEARVPENVPDYMVTQVKAEDPDTNQRVTYVIRQGPSDLFAIDPKTGVIRTIRGLDYERESQYILVVGTLENPGSGPGATARVVVNVEDRNDIPPVFTAVARPVTLEDDVGIGTKVTTLTATDSDGTAPGNKVRYELIGRGKASKYFQVDPDTGVLSVRDDLRKETDQDYQVMEQPRSFCLHADYSFLLLLESKSSQWDLSVITSMRTVWPTRQNDDS